MLRIVVSFFLLLGGLLFAEPIELFPDGIQSPQYYQLLAKAFEAGAELKFPDGSHFKVKKYLGEGFVTRVFQVEVLNPKPGEPKEMALRLPMGGGAYYADFINQTQKGYEPLRSEGIAIPKLFRSTQSQYCAMEYIPHDFDGEAFLMNSQRWGPEVAREARAALVEFARQAALMGTIGDFKPEQLVYQIENKRWVLLDWTGTLKFKPRFDKLEPSFVHNMQLHYQQERQRPLTREEKKLIDEMKDVIRKERWRRAAIPICIANMRWMMDRAFGGKR